MLLRLSTHGKHTRARARRGPHVSIVPTRALFLFLATFASLSDANPVVLPLALFPTLHGGNPCQPRNKRAVPVHCPRPGVDGRRQNHGGGKEGRRDRPRGSGTGFFCRRAGADEDTGGWSVRGVQPPQRAVRRGHQQVKTEVGAGREEEDRKTGRSFCAHIFARTLCARQGSTPPPV